MRLACNSSFLVNILFLDNFQMKPDLKLIVAIMYFRIFLIRNMLIKSTNYLQFNFLRIALELKLLVFDNLRYLQLIWSYQLFKVEANFLLRYFLI